MQLTRSSSFFRIIFSFAGLTMMLAYTNCTKAPDSGSGVVESASSSTLATVNSGTLPRVEGADLCETDLMNLFARGYHAFARVNCVQCHQNGPGKGRFASADVKSAFADFMQIGHVKVSNNAVNASHQPPATGPQHIQTVNELKIEWLKGVSDFDLCRGQASSQMPVDIRNLVQLETSRATVPVSETQASGKLTWDLSTQINKADGTPAQIGAAGGKFEILVQRGKTAGGETYYLFTQPRIFGSKGDLHVKSIFVKINGQLPRYQTTFRYLDTSVRASTAASANSLISTGSLVVPGVLSTQDQISIGFEKIEITNLPAAPPPLTVQFEGAEVVTPPLGAAYLDLPVVLSSAATSTLNVSFESVSDAATCFKGVTEANTSTFFKPVGAADCFPSVKAFLCGLGKCTAADLLMGRARSVVGVEFNRFDWDYKFQGLTLTFAPGEIRKSLRVFLSKDTRHENNRLLSLKIGSFAGFVQLGSLSQVHVVMNKVAQPTPDPNLPTYSELIHPQSGILGQNCLKCHNSATKAGGYDMSNYDEMVANGVLVPGKPDSSKMFKRLNPNDPSSQFLQSMPLDGFMEQALIREVEKWLLDGAKNN